MEELTIHRELLRAAEAGVISHDHCRQICACFHQYQDQAGVVIADISDLPAEARQAMYRAIDWMEEPPA